MKLYFLLPPYVSHILIWIVQEYIEAQNENILRISRPTSILLKKSVYCVSSTKFTTILYNCNFFFVHVFTCKQLESRRRYALTNFKFPVRVPTYYTVTCQVIISHTQVQVAYGDCCRISQWGFEPRISGVYGENSIRCWLIQLLESWKW